jgi:hypothetical protein
MGYLSRKTDPNLSSKTRPPLPNTETVFKQRKIAGPEPKSDCADEGQAASTVFS